MADLPSTFFPPRKPVPTPPMRPAGLPPPARPSPLTQSSSSSSSPDDMPPSLSAVTAPAPKRSPPPPPGSSSTPTAGNFPPPLPTSAKPPVPSSTKMRSATVGVNGGTAGNSGAGIRPMGLNFSGGNNPAASTVALPSAPPKTLTQLSQGVIETDGSFNEMKTLIHSLTDCFSKQLLHFQGFMEEGTKLALIMQEYSMNCVNGETTKMQSLGHCLTSAGSLTRCIHAIHEPKLKNTFMQSVGIFNQLLRDLEEQGRARASLKEDMEKLDDLNSKLSTLQQRAAKVDLVKVGDLQQARETLTAKCRKQAEDILSSYFNTEDQVNWKLLEQFAAYTESWGKYFKESSELMEQLKPKTSDWRQQSSVVREHQERKLAESMKSSAVNMGNATLQILANVLQSFVDGMQTIVQSYLGKAMSDGALFAEMGKEDLASIFSNTPALLDLGSMLLKKLSETSSLAKTFGPLLPEIIDQFSKYINFYPGSTNALHTFKKKSKTFSSILKAQEQLGSPSLKDLLTLPLKYAKDLADFLGNAPPNVIGSPQEQHILLQCVETLTELARESERTRRHVQCRDIIRVVDGVPEADAVPPPQRLYVSEHQVIIASSPGQIFIFNDMILLAKKASAIQQTLLKKPFLFTATIKLNLLNVYEGPPDPDQNGRYSLDISDGAQAVTVFTESDDLRRSVATSLRNSKADMDKSKIFGVPLAEIIKREKGRDIPNFIEEALDSLERTGLDAEGLFRISGSQREIDELKTKIDNGVPVSFDDVSCHCTAGLVKLFLRNLPEPLLTYGLYETFTDAVSRDSDAEVIYLLKEAVTKLPASNQALLQVVILLLSKINARADENKMNSRNLSIVFGPALLRGKSDRSAAPASLEDSGGATYLVVQKLVENYQPIFSSIERSRKTTQGQRKLPPAFVYKQPQQQEMSEAFSDFENSLRKASSLFGSSQDSNSGSDMTLSLKDIMKQGSMWLLVGADKKATWTQLWFILKKGYLFCFKSQGETVAKFMIALARSTLAETPQKRSFAFTITAGADKTEYPIAAGSAEEMASWISAIKACS